MAFGGGSFSSFNKVLPGVYVNFVSADAATAQISDRGTAAVAMELDWGPEGEFLTLTADEFMRDSVKYFGYSYTNGRLRALRDLFMNASAAHIYRLGTGVKASNTYAEARYGGVCGNNIVIKVVKNIDNNALFDVSTYYSGVKKDTQTVASAKDLTDNSFVIWKKSAQLTSNASASMTGGTNATVTGENYQEFLDAAESVSFNALGAATTDAGVNSLIAAYTKRMRNERGIKFQSVLYNCEADDIGVINVVTASLFGNEADMVWFVTGACAGCGINESLMNKQYFGSCNPSGTYTQAELEEHMKKGHFVIHRVGNQYRILADINSLVSVSAECGDVFKDNQTVRIIDQIAYDDANLFKEKYMGAVPNDEAGRLSLWNDIVKHRRSLERMRAIENFKDEDVEVSRGDKKTEVVISSRICPINSMAQLYITTMIE